MDRTGNTPTTARRGRDVGGINKAARLCEFTDRSSQENFLIFTIQFQQNSLESFKVTFLVFLHMLAKHHRVRQGCSVEHARPRPN
jgi:hypothetical protein